MSSAPDINNLPNPPAQCLWWCSACRQDPPPKGHQWPEFPHDCPMQHRQAWELPQGAELGQLVQSNGIAQYKVRCGWCGQESGAVLGRRARQWIAKGAEVKWRRINEPTVYPQCAVEGCDADGKQIHHWAPVNTFGWREADKWPQEALCQSHHTEWHKRMDGYRWTRKGIDWT